MVTYAAKLQLYPVNPVFLFGQKWVSSFILVSCKRKAISPVTLIYLRPYLIQDHVIGKYSFQSLIYDPLFIQKK